MLPSRVEATFAMSVKNNFLDFILCLFNPTPLSNYWETIFLSIDLPIEYIFLEKPGNLRDCIGISVIFM